ncbi:hypothetical protein JCM5353_008472 [Sporobolomyces roseus]
MAILEQADDQSAPNRLFRKVVLHTPTAVTGFANSLNQDLVTGGGVKTVEFRATTLPATAGSSIDAIFEMCPNMTSLSCAVKSGAVYWSIFGRVQWGSGFRNLRQLTLPWFDDPVTFHPETLLWLNKLEQLDDLTILDLPSFQSVPDSYNLDLKIRYFNLLGGAAFGIGARLILGKLGSLVGLRLTEAPDARGNPEKTLLAIQAPLETLSLSSHIDADVSILSRFDTLHTLDINTSSTYSLLSADSDLPTTVSTLHLRQDGMVTYESLLFIANFVNSRDNPDCHEQVRRLEVSLLRGGGGRIGSRVDPELVDDPGWNDPYSNTTPWDVPISIRLTRYPAWQTFRRRRPNDKVFELVGNFIDAVETTEAFLLELHNRAVLSSFLQRDIGGINVVRETDTDYYPPKLREIGEEERADLELVRNYLPERKWFALSLRNRSSRRVYGRWSSR